MKYINVWTEYVLQIKVSLSKDMVLNGVMEKTRWIPSPKLQSIVK